MTMQEKIIITCALTGGAPVPRNHPNFPVTPQQIADQGLAAAEAGAAILHIHVRNIKTGAMAWDLDLYAETIDLIRAHNKDVIFNLTTSPGMGYWPDPEDPKRCLPQTHIFSARQRVEHVLALKPEICTLDLVTGHILGHVVMNLEPILVEMAALIRGAGVTPELELWHCGDTVLANSLIEAGALDGPGIYSFVMGLKYAMAPTPDTMMYFKNQLPKGAQFTGFGVSRHAFPMLAQSVLLGGHARVGLEDNIYLSQGVIAPDNASLVTKAVDIIRHLGTNVATPAEARRILGLSSD